MNRPVLLIIDDNPEYRRMLRDALRDDFDLREGGSAEAALSQLSPPPDVILLDLRLRSDDPRDRSGANLLTQLHDLLPDVPILMVTAHGDVEIAVECMRLGASDFIQKKTRLNANEIRMRIQRAMEHGRLSRRVAQLTRELSVVEPRKLFGDSVAIQDVRRSIDAVARDATATVLIRGETGTGKELVARAIHASGARADGPFVPVVLSALPATLAEGELFGHEPGAFTDARFKRVGLLEQSHGGILFLDEIGDTEPGLQVKLLRFLEEREFQRLGSTRMIGVNVQIIAATNADLEALVNQHRFREDLYFRLKVHELHIPPLREHIEDVPLLTRQFLKLLRQQGKRVAQVSADALVALQRYDWPGNIRQLRNAIESAALRADVDGRSIIIIDDLPADVARRGAGSNGPRVLGEEGFTIAEALAREELAHVSRALQMSGGRKCEAGQLLGYNDRFTFGRRVRRILDSHPQLAVEFIEVKTSFARRKT